MLRRRVGDVMPAIVTAVGVVLFVAAGIHHVREALTIGAVRGPGVALLLDGVPALGLVVAGFYLRGVDLDPDHRWIVATGCVAGGILLLAVHAMSVLVRWAEGRTVGEPVFSILIAADAGAIMGLVAGYAVARARQDAARAREATRSLSFVNGLLRHDVRNHLTSIEAQGELLRAEVPEEAVDDRIEAMNDRIYEAAALIESAEAVTETVAGEASMEAVDLTELVRETTERVAENTDATVVTDLSESATVLANEGVRSVVANLVENAVEHNDSDDPTVEVAVDVDDDFVTLRVDDDGPGIPDERKESVFQGREDATHGGGLSMVSTLVDRYGGSIRVEDNQPRGSAFVVELPRPREQ